MCQITCCFIARPCLRRSQPGQKATSHRHLFSNLAAFVTVTDVLPSISLSLSRKSDRPNHRSWHRRPRLVRTAGVNSQSLVSREPQHPPGFWGGDIHPTDTRLPASTQISIITLLTCKGIHRSVLPYPLTPTPTCLPLLWPAAVSSSESMRCGLALDEQSYYEKSNPSLGDRGVTGFKKTPSDLIPTFLGSQTPCSKWWNGESWNITRRKTITKLQSLTCVFLDCKRKAKYQERQDRRKKK